MIRRLLLLDQPQETRFFLFLGGFGIVLGAIYWLLTYEVAGTTLLLGFGLGTGLLGIGLYRSRPRAVARGLDREAAAQPPGKGEERAPASAARGDAGERSAPVEQLVEGSAEDLPGGGTGGVDVPFEDPVRRLPDETLAPLSLGLGIALSLTAVVFGPWLLIAGLLPITWGAWTWLSRARDELDATVEDERSKTLATRDAADSAGPAAAPHHARPEP